MSDTEIIERLDTYLQSKPAYMFAEALDGKLQEGLSLREALSKVLENLIAEWAR